jgi:hypothetical protein
MLEPADPPAAPAPAALPPAASSQQPTTRPSINPTSQPQRFMFSTVPAQPIQLKRSEQRYGC